jgi:hypothetical protein
MNFIDTRGSPRRLYSPRAHLWKTVYGWYACRAGYGYAFDSDPAKAQARAEHADKILPSLRLAGLVGRHPAEA